MTGKDCIQNMFRRKPTGRNGFWLGNPADETKIVYAEKLGILSPEHREGIPESFLKTTGIDLSDIELHAAFKSDLFWASPDLIPNLYRHPEGKPIFDVYPEDSIESLGQGGVFADFEDVSQVETFDWPNPDYLDFSSTIELIDEANKMGMAVLSGMWMPFFHNLCDFFGMENYFLKMFTSPKVVEAATEKVLEFHLEANRRILDLAADRIDAVFFGNDLGSQDNILIRPDQFERFVYPAIKKIIEQTKSYGLNVVLHSCGAVSDFIPYFIEAGIDGLHPLQARANGMDAVNLAKKYKNDLVFVGGVDTQQLLPFGTPQQVKDEVYRLKDIFGERFVVSPSHEALLPNVPIQNAIAMMEAALF